MALSLVGGIVGAAALGSLAASAIPTQMKAPFGPDWRDRYATHGTSQVAAMNSQETYYVEPGMQDLTPMHDRGGFDPYTRSDYLDPQLAAGDSYDGLYGAGSDAASAADLAAASETGSYGDIVPVMSDRADANAQAAAQAAADTLAAQASL